MSIPIKNSRELPNTWRILDDKLGSHRERGLPFRLSYVGAFSQQLAEYFIRIYSNPGDIIFEPFGGRGTTIMQAMWHERNVICNDLSPYSNVMCHSIMWVPQIRDVIGVLKMLEEYIRDDSNKISVEYAGKGSENDVAKLYESSTFSQIVKLRNLLNSKEYVFGRYSYNDIDDKTYKHEIIMFLRMAFTQLVLGNKPELSFNGLKVRGTDNTNVKALLRYYESMGSIPKHVNIFERMKEYIEKMGLDEIGISRRFNKLNRNLISNDVRKLSLPDKCADMVLTSPPYYGVINYGMSNWLRIWSISGLGDPLIGKHINTDNTEKQNNSEIYGKVYDKITDSAEGTIDNPKAYSRFTGLYLRELYRILKDDAVAVIVVGDYGSKRKIEAWRVVADRAEIFGFKPQLIIMDELNKDTKSSSQFQNKFEGGKNDYDVCVVLFKGNYKQKNDPEKVDFRWGAKFADSRQKNIVDSWGT